MDKKRFYQILCNISKKETYGEVPEFKLRFIRTTNNIDLTYDIRNATITLYNTGVRDDFYIMTSAIHGMAHHCDYNRRGETNHDEDFFRLFYNLLQEAAIWGYIEADEVNNCDKPDISYVIKRYGSLDSVYGGFEILDTRLILVKGDTYSYRSLLSKLNYSWDNEEGAWYYEVKKKQADKEAEDIKSIIPAAQVIIKEPTYAHFAKDIIITVSGNTYKNKNLLRKKGFHYEKNDRVWKKNTLDTMIDKEELSNIDGIHVDVTSNEPSVLKAANS